MVAEFHIAGKSVPKPMVYASAAAAVGILAYAYWQHRSTPATTDGEGVDPNIDPATGIPYGDEFGSDNGYTGSTPVGGGGYYNTDTGVLPGTTNTNANWTQAAAAFLETAGYDKATVLAALGKVFAGSAVTDEEASIFQAAIASQGNPPQGYPVLHTTVPGGQGGGNGGDNGNGNGGTTPAPGRPVTGKGPVSGLKASAVYQTGVKLDWEPVKGASGYVVDRNGDRMTTVVYSTAFVPGSAGKRYTFGVTPLKSDRNLGTRKTIGVTLKAAPKKKVTVPKKTIKK